MPRKTQHRFHGAPERFEVVAELIYNRYGKGIRHIADVAGGQGMLSRILRKKFNYDSEAADPRGWSLRGIAAQGEEFDPSMAAYYDLIVSVRRGARGDD